MGEERSQGGGSSGAVDENGPRRATVNRDEQLRAIRENVKNENLVKHMIATEAIMRGLARRFGENEGEWAAAGLLHDIDVELTNADL
jgi:predicted hydrolase (HD superfamily)